MWPKLVTAYLAVTLSAASATGQDVCDPNDFSQQAMTTCAAARFAAADAELSALLAEHMGPGFDPKGVALLKKAQNAWIAFRDAECEYAASDSWGGSIYPMLLSECATHLTKARIKQLQDDGRCEAGVCDDESPAVPAPE
jgi:uncharacterized protein YecT (DUF1311 family)